MERHLFQVEGKTNLHIDRLQYYRRYDDLLRFWGWPKTSGGWCTACKRYTAIKYERAVHAEIIYIGFSADEQNRANRPSIHNKRKWQICFPLIDAGMTEKDALKYCYSLGYTWDGLYENFNRVSCYLCPKAGKSRIKLLQEKYPKLYSEYLRKRLLAEQEGK